MHWPTVCAAVIPCLNEGKAIGAVVAGVRAHLETVLVIDDGSSDDTAEAATTAGAVVIRSGCNQGKGAALQTGWNEAQRRGFAWVLMLDGDGQHAAEDIPTLFAGGERTGAHLVIGNRMEAAAGMTPIRRGVNRWMSRRLSRLTGRPLPDTQCGFRLAQLHVLTHLELPARHYEIESDMLVGFLRVGARVEFVPVRIPPIRVRSHIRPGRDTLRWLRWWIGAWRG